MKDLAPHTVAQKNRRIDDADPDLRVAFLGDVTLDLLPPYVRVLAHEQGLTLATYVGGFGQHVQELLDKDSGLHGFNPDVIFLAAEKGVDACLAATLEHTAATLLVCNRKQPRFLKAGLGDLAHEDGETKTRLQKNLDLLRSLRDKPRAHYFDLDTALARAGESAYDPKMHYLARMAWSEHALKHIAELIVRHLRAVTGSARKCLVLDLDNTLWGGVVGEDGVDGIRIGPGDPVSEAYRDFQLHCKAIASRGIVLAVCSKNNPADVAEAFAKRDMPLKESDFATMEVNWDHKHENLKRIAETLNIGTDALVFLDDNPAEAELVRQMMPEVHVVLLPDDPALRPQALEELAEFENYAILDEDRKKTERYRDERQRKRHQGTVGDLTAYLESLQTKLSIRAPEPADLARVHQLFSKTNQFNLTTIRYSVADIDGFLKDESCTLKVVEAKDRFGELGIIGLYFLRGRGDHVEIDSFVLSCRAMGRGIETALMNDIKARGDTMRGRFVPTRKNVPVKEFFEREGFRVVSQADDGTKDYELSPENSKPGECGWIGIG